MKKTLILLTLIINLTIAENYSLNFYVITLVLLSTREKVFFWEMHGFQIQRKF